MGLTHARSITVIVQHRSVYQIIVLQHVHIQLTKRVHICSSAAELWPSDERAAVEGKGPGKVELEEEEEEEEEEDRLSTSYRAGKDERTLRRLVTA